MAVEIDAIQNAKSIGWTDALLSRLAANSVSLNASLTLSTGSINLTGTGNGIFSAGSYLYVGGSSAGGGARLSHEGVVVPSGGRYAWGSSSSGSAVDTIILRDAANTLALRNGANAQAFNIYNTYTSGSVYERGFMRWNANTLEIGTEHVGGSSRSLYIQPSNEFRFGGGGNVQFRVDGSKLFPTVNNSQDLGTSTLRFKNGYFAGTLSFGAHSAIGAETVTGFITITDAGGTSRKLAVVS